MISGDKGYEISLVKVKNILNVRAWGVWNGDDRELAENFERELQENVKEIRVNGQDWSVCGDLLDLHARSKEVCRILGNGIMFAIKHGMKKAVHPQR
jgi:hypothetical protein